MGGHMNKAITPDILGDWWLLRQKTSSFFDFGQLSRCALKAGVWTFHVYGKIDTTLKDNEPYAQLALTEEPAPMGVIYAAARAMDFSGDIRKKPGPKKSMMFSMDRDEHAYVRAQAPRPSIDLKVKNCEALILLESTNVGAILDDGA
jgi:hypothetical protein